MHTDLLPRSSTSSPPAIHTILGFPFTPHAAVCLFLVVAVTPGVPLVLPVCILYTKKDVICNRRDATRRVHCRWYPSRCPTVGPHRTTTNPSCCYDSPLSPFSLCPPFTYLVCTVLDGLSRYNVRLYIRLTLATLCPYQIIGLSNCDHCVLCRRAPPLSSLSRMNFVCSLHLYDSAFSTGAADQSRLTSTTASYFAFCCCRSPRFAHSSSAAAFRHAELALLVLSRRPSATRPPRVLVSVVAPLLRSLVLPPSNSYLISPQHSPRSCLTTRIYSAHCQEYVSRHRRRTSLLAMNPFRLFHSPLLTLSRSRTVIVGTWLTCI
jgi:hypothetical protein